MKKITVFVAAILFAGFAIADPPAGKAKKGTNYGVKVNKKGAISAEEMKASMADKETAEVKVKGKVIEVCKAEGCWIRMETAQGPLLIKMKDHAFLVPLALNGKTIVAEGTATFKETSVETLRHYAEDAGKSKEEIEAIKEPKKEIVLQAKGILVI